LFERFNIEVLTTTDSGRPASCIHREIRESGWGGWVPSFRPDAVFRIAKSGWKRRDRVARRTARARDPGLRVVGAGAGERRAFFRSMGATATDHAVLEPYTERVPDSEADRIFQKALRGEATVADQRRFEAHMLMEMARMSTEDGW
jgi:glucuronate isomerase